LLPHPALIALAAYVCRQLNSAGSPCTHLHLMSAYIGPPSATHTCLPAPRHHSATRQLLGITQTTETQVQGTASERTRPATYLTRTDSTHSFNPTQHFLPGAPQQPLCESDVSLHRQQNTCNPRAALTTLRKLWKTLGSRQADNSLTGGLLNDRCCLCGWLSPLMREHHG
jgi:hypothetical protein